MIVVDSVFVQLTLFKINSYKQKKIVGNCLCAIDAHSCNR